MNMQTPSVLRTASSGNSNKHKHKKKGKPYVFAIQLHCIFIFIKELKRPLMHIKAKYEHRQKGNIKCTLPEEVLRWRTNADTEFFFFPLVDNKT